MMFRKDTCVIFLSLRKSKERATIAIPAFDRLPALRRSQVHCERAANLPDSLALHENFNPAC